MASQKDKQRKRRFRQIADLIASPMTSDARVTAVQEIVGGSRKRAQEALRRVRLVLRKRHGAEAESEAFEQVERLRQLAADARASGDYQAQIQAERLIADVVGTKAASKSEHKLTSSLADLVELGRQAERERERGE